MTPMTTQALLLEVMYIVSGLVAIVAAVYTLRDKNHPSPKLTALFWTLFGLIFIIGKYMPAELVGGLILVMGLLTALKKVTFGSLANATEAFRLEKSQKIGNALFIPALTIGLVAFIFGQFIPSLGGLVGLGAGAFLAMIVALALTKAAPNQVTYDSSRLLLQIGAASILPQLLASLGALFTKAGVGEVIAAGIGGIIPEGNALAGVIAYCVGMAIFTMIMGNAFAAFAVITVGIGIPFVFAQGANPAIAGALALTAGYCGTLMTPMAANFNIVPAAILEAKNKNQVILAQVPFGLVLLVVHIILMYILAF